MSAEAEGDREQRALEALIASALCRDDQDEDMDPACLPPMDEEKERALENVGQNFIQRIVSGDWRGREEPPEPDCGAESDLAMAGESACFGLDRAEEVDEEAQAELDEQRRRIREEKREHRDDDGEETGT